MTREQLIKAIASKACLECAERQLAEYEARIKDAVIDDIKELMKKYIGFENIDIFVEALEKLREQK